MSAQQGQQKNNDTAAAPEARRAPAGRTGKPQQSPVAKRLANGLVALSSAAVIAVYAAGYAHTGPAAASVGTGMVAQFMASSRKDMTAPCWPRGSRRLNLRRKKTARIARDRAQALPDRDAGRHDRSAIAHAGCAARNPSGLGTAR